MVLLRGEQPCLWLYTVEQWKLQKEEAIRANPSLFVRRRFNAKQDVEMDKQGRILVPPTLREYARLSKDCIVVGQDHYIEIWAKDRYDEYIEATGEDFKAAWEELSAPQRGRDFANGSIAHPGSAGADAGAAGPEGGA
jgi:MraZ protein